ncbi:eisosome protein SEG2 [Heracleum sosnowskyi]|uniref:Eisosome protein SEG2 n=1 Tax=Heracleum sosnowskyi TaxID=360622 RepID=A0AAD8J6U7_9APIA|nr:eisosome protein SEG2 [Heracleum sosnowskyi]
MGCFLGCFGSSKDKKRKKLRKYGSPRLQKIGGQTLVQTTETPVLSIPEKVAYSVLESSDEKSEEQLSVSTRKKVTFDSNVQTYEHVTVYGSTDSLLEKNDASEKDVEEEKEEEEKDGLARSRQSRTSSEDGSTISSVGSYPQNHRYQNCRDSDDEAVESEYEESDLDDEEEEDEYGDDDSDDEINDGSMLCQEVWSETIPVESKESRTGVSLKRVGSEDVDSPMLRVLPEQEVKTVVMNRNARDRSVYVHPVLNPVENLSQWKAVKSKGTSVLPNQKENTVAEEAPRISFSLEPSFKQSSHSSKPQSNHQIKNQNKEMAVDASLSNWLVTPEKKSSIKLQTMTSEKSMSQGSNSVMSIEDRPILGALTLEELNQFSATSTSPRKSPSRSPDDMVLMGTVGTYWKHTGEARNSGSASSYKGIPNTTSKYREDKKVNWHSTPFETRLERALNRGSAEV